MPQPVQLSVVVVGGGAGEGASAAAGHEEETKQLMEQYSQVSPYPQHFATREPSFPEN